MFCVEEQRGGEAVKTTGVSCRGQAKGFRYNPVMGSHGRLWRGRVSWLNFWERII